MSRRPPWLTWAVLAASGALVVATWPVAWWLVGDLSARDDGAGLDYLAQVEIDARLEAAAALAGAIAGLTAAIALLRPGAARPRRWNVGVGILALASALAAAGARVVTAGVQGANIGGGMVVVFGGPLLVGLAAVGVAHLVRAACAHT